MLAAVVRRIVDTPDAVVIQEIATADGVRYEITVAPGDVGRVIGRQGKVIRALRTLTRSVAAQGGRRVDVELAQP